MMNPWANSLELTDFVMKLAYRTTERKVLIDCF